MQNIGHTKLDKGTKLDLVYLRAFPNWKLSPEKIFAKMHLFGLEAEKWGITRWINVIWIIVLRCSGEKSGLQLICESSALPWSSLHPIQGAVNNFQYFCQVLISYCKVASTNTSCLVNHWAGLDHLLNKLPQKVVDWNRNMQFYSNWKLFLTWNNNKILMLTTFT